jgi:deoxyribonucleoside regulator
VRQSDEIERLAQVAYWYYVQELSQDAIAARIGMSRSNVSRMLQAARRKQIVRFDIRYPLARDAVLEARIRARFAATSLREVLVMSSSAERSVEPGQTAHLTISRAAGDWLASHLGEGDTLGLSWGGTMQAVVDVAYFPRRIDALVVQLAGEVSLDSKHSGHDLVRDLADKFGGRYSYFNAPAVASTAELAAALGESSQVRHALTLARSADVALLGIGEFDHGTSKVFLDHAELTGPERREAQAKGVAGQLCGRFFDRSGQQLDLVLHRRILSLDLDDVRRIPTKVIVAGQAVKLGPTVAALRGDLIDVLIVDDELGRLLVDAPGG